MKLVVIITRIDGKLTIKVGEVNADGQTNKTA